MSAQPWLHSATPDIKMQQTTEVFECLGQVAAPDNLAPQSSILSGGDKGFLHPSSLLSCSNTLPSHPPVSVLSQMGRFDVACSERAAVGHGGCVSASTVGIRGERVSIGWGSPVSSTFRFH
ncbi:hypothetical protein CRENBAI_012238 [Crenichthys baileyi]|uniref:Uncharacterized protein n=1 Tax=Crenichthys baileyi TaxID=28760 RepID=A0AAV9S6Y2_9TELE